MKPIQILLMAAAASGGTFIRTIHIGNSGVPVNLRNLANAQGYTETRDSQITFIVDPGAVLTGGIVGGDWPAGKTHVPILNVEGKVYGSAGVGGYNPTLPFGADGGNGGDAINCTQPIEINIIAGGEIKGGGGGGGSGGGWSANIGPPGETEYVQALGGAGGAGFPFQAAGSPGEDADAGTGGAGGDAAIAGLPGETATRGGMGDYTNNTGGAGGQPGYAIRKNGHAVPVNNLGTIVGTQA